MIKFVSVRANALIFMFLANAITLTAQINYPAQSTYNYLKGSNAANLSSNWVNSDFDDASWQAGNAPFRYGDGTGGTELTDMQGNYSTLYLRNTFMVQHADLVEEITITADWDDGFVLFINGTEVVSRQAPALLSYDVLSIGMHEYGETEIIKLSAVNLNLIEGENTLAVFCCNTSLSESSDFYFDMSITASVVMPNLPELVDSIGLSFNKASGFYDSNFTLTINTPVTDAKVVYTLDGSNPQTSSTRIIGNSSTQVAINPASSVYRGTTPAVVVRASIIKEGFSASKPELRTYIYPEKVKTQKQPGWDWPTWNVNGQAIDLDMDADVVNSAQYKDKIEEALKDIPSISIATDNANLFDPTIGIYVNALEQGEEWERECSVELINSDGSDGFNVNAGLRIRGGWSRHGDYPKHAFRLFFREEYGDSKLYYPLFGDEGVDRFDKVDLRCEQNYSWANWEGEHNTFIREVFLRDAQGETGSPYTRSRYYHLYLNGMYWGLFQTQERSEARWASDYLGGKNEDWDILKIGGVYDKNIVATDGNTDKWREVWNLTEKGFTGNANYFKLEGKDAEGKPLKDSEILVDIDNLIDYMINIFYSGNFDSPVSIWGGNNSPNNLYIVKNREDKTLGFQFLVHDAEHTLMTVGTSGPGTIGLEENRVNLAYRDDGKMTNPGFDRFHTQWLHHKLTSNMEYKVRFADRAWKHFNGNGIFTEDACVERLNKRASQIEMAVIAESARWGDTKTGDAYTKDNAWIPELNVLRNEYFPYRTDIVMDQLYEYDLYPSVAAPVIAEAGNEILDEQVFITASTSITFTSTSGEIYYTLNGTDPRLIGGDLSADAKKIASGSSVTIPQSAVVKARVFKNNMWSAIKAINFIAKQENYSKLKVTELHYNPLDSIIGTDTTPGDDFEFIEFKNTGTASALNLSGLVIDSAIYFEFPENTLLAPQQYYVVAAKPKKFFDRYGMLPSGNFSKSFANSGEQLIITNSEGAIIMDFWYDDKNPWPESPDGDGSSLVSYSPNPGGDPNIYSYWTNSAQIHGSPFYEDDFSTPVEEFEAVNIAEAFMVYPNPASDFINVNYTGNGETDFALKLYNISGMLMFSEAYSNKANISLSSLNIDAGMYFLQIESGNKLVTKKVVYAPF